MRETHPLLQDQFKSYKVKINKMVQPYTLKEGGCEDFAHQIIRHRFQFPAAEL